MYHHFYPVIHAHNHAQIIANIDIALEADCDGVFLINHGRMSDAEFDNSVIIAVKQIQHVEFGKPAFRIGVNYLNKSPAVAMRKAVDIGCGMLWHDNAQTDSFSLAEAQEVVSIQNSVEWPPLYFGGVQFKYQEKPQWDISESLRRAYSYVNVPTISGAGTGQAAKVGFVKKAAETDVRRPLALASGVSIDNVEDYLPYIKHFLVASSIIHQKSDDETFDFEKVEELSRKIRG